jgi:hypothetical protein
MAESVTLRTVSKISSRWFFEYLIPNRQGIDLDRQNTILILNSSQLINSAQHSF